MRQPDFYAEVEFGGDDLEPVGVWIEGVDPGCPGSDVEPYAPPEIEISVDADDLTWEQWDDIRDQAEEHYTRELENARDMAGDAKLEAMRDEQ